MNCFRLLLLLGFFQILKCDTINFINYDPSPRFIPKEKLAEFLEQSKFYQNETIEKLARTIDNLN